MKLFGMDKARLLHISLGMNACFFAALLAWAAAGGPAALRGSPAMLDPHRRQQIMRDELHRLFGSLDLTAKQSEDLEAKSDSAALEFSERFGRGHAARVDGLARIAESPDDEEIFREVVDEAIRDHRDATDILFRGMREAARELTPEQRTKLAAALRERLPPPPMH